MQIIFKVPGRVSVQVDEEVSGIGWGHDTGLEKKNRNENKTNVERERDSLCYTKTFYIKFYLCFN